MGSNDDRDESDTDDDRIVGHYLTNVVTSFSDGVTTDPVFLPCHSLIGVPLEELERVEATGPRPSLHACDVHFLEIPDTPHGS